MGKTTFKRRLPSFCSLKLKNASAAWTHTKNQKKTSSKNRFSSFRAPIINMNYFNINFIVGKDRDEEMFTMLWL